MLADQGTVDNDKLNLTYCHITSPADGRVGIRLVDPGNYVQTSDATGLFVVTHLQPISVLFTLPEDDVDQVQAQMAAGALQVQAYDRTNTKLIATGTLATTDNQIDATTGTVKLRAMFPNPDNALFPQQFVNARLLVQTLKGVVVAPQARHPDRRAGRIRLPRQAGRHRLDAGGEDRRGPGRPGGGHGRAEAGRHGGDGRAGPPARRRKDHGRRAAGPAGRAARRAAIGTPQHERARRKMSPSRPFILRPVGTTLLMAAILLVGIIAYRFLPISALPEVDYPTIQVQTFYPGASPEVMTTAVTAPLERQFGAMPGLGQMSSVSSGGASVITLQFTLSLSLDVAEQEVQAAINAATNLLPSDLPAPPIYNKVNPADTPVLTLALTSKTVPLTQIEDLADVRLAQKISQQPGVGLVSISGGNRPAVRVVVNPRALSAYGLAIDDVRTIIANQNTDTPKGSFDGVAQSSTINDNDQLVSADQYRGLIIAYKNGRPVRLSDVATVVNGAENNQLAAWANRTPAVILNVQRQPGSNVIAVVNGIKALLPRLQATMPAAVDLAVLSDRTTTIRASVSDVEFELGLAVALVVLVIFLFLRNLPATLIPSLSVPLSLVGTLAAMYLLGFSLDNLSLMALTISTGFVVDDAIVMIENIARHVEDGDAPLEAALRGSEEIGFTIISLTVSLIAVLIPLLFMGDVVGRLFNEFAVTLSVTIILSAIVSLTLVPMLCALLVKHRPADKRNRLDLWAERGFDRIIAGYGRWLNWVLDHQILTLLVALLTFGATVGMYVVIPKGFFPIQDTGAIQGISEAAQDTSFGAMAAHQQMLADAILKDPAVESLSSFIGVDGTNTTLNAGRFQINLKPVAERGLSVTQVIARLQRELRVPGINLSMQPVQDLTIDSTVSRAQYHFFLENPDATLFAAWVPKLVDRLAATPAFSAVTSDMNTNGRALDMVVDRATASRFGITPATIDNALYDAFGQRIVSTLYTQSNQYRVHPACGRDRPAEPATGVGRDLSAVRHRDHRAGPAGGHGAPEHPRRAVAGGASGPVPGRVDIVQPGRRRVAGQGGGRDRRGAAGHRAAGQLHPGLPGRAVRVPGVAVQRAAADPGGAGRGLRGAGRAVRELHPPADHPVHAAIRRRGRADRAGPDRARPRHHRDHRHHPADRHREEERDHDDRLRARRRTHRRQGAAGRDLPGLPAALPPHPDDHHGGHPRRAAADAGQRRGFGAAPAAGHRHRRRPAGQPGADPVHHAGDLPHVRRAGAAVDRPAAEPGYR